MILRKLRLIVCPTLSSRGSLCYFVFCCLVFCFYFVLFFFHWLIWPVHYRQTSSLCLYCFLCDWNPCLCHSPHALLQCSCFFFSFLSFLVLFYLSYFVLLPSLFFCLFSSSFFVYPYSSRGFSFTVIVLSVVIFLVQQFFFFI